GGQRARDRGRVDEGGGALVAADERHHLDGRGRFARGQTQRVRAGDRGGRFGAVPVGTRRRDSGHPGREGVRDGHDTRMVGRPQVGGGQRVGDLGAGEHGTGGV